MRRTCQHVRSPLGSCSAASALPKLVKIIHDLQASVVCEGIETPSQHQLAIEVGVDRVRGFLFASAQTAWRHGLSLQPQMHSHESDGVALLCGAFMRALVHWHESLSWWQRCRR